MLDMQRQQLEISREMIQVNREQRARQVAELERWQAEGIRFVQFEGPLGQASFLINFGLVAGD